MLNYSINNEFENPEDKNSELELLIQRIRLLETVKELTPIYGPQTVKEFMQLGGLLQTTPNSESIDTNLVDFPLRASSQA